MSQPEGATMKPQTNRMPYRSFAEASSYRVAPITDESIRTLYPKKDPVWIYWATFLLIVFPFTSLVLWLLDGFCNAFTKFWAALWGMQ